MSILKYIKFVKEKINEIGFTKTKRFLREDLKIIKELLDKITGEKLTTSKKLTRNTFLYTEGADEKYAQCESCVQSINGENCEVVKGKIKAKGSCNLYTPGEGSKERRLHLPVYTKTEVGYVEDSVRCEHCNYFTTYCELYEKLNYILPDLVDLDKDVKKFGCCTAWTEKIS